MIHTSFLSRVVFAAGAVALVFWNPILLSAEAPAGGWIAHSPGGGLVYGRDGQGNRVPDFSNVGYKGGGVRLPDVPEAVSLEPEPGDNHARIQAAIAEVSGRPAGPDGFRGALVLKKGVYEVSAPLQIRAGGVVLRGEGQEREGGTVLVATYRANQPLISIAGPGARAAVSETRTAISDAVVPVGAKKFQVADASGFAPGDLIVVRRMGNAAWISEIEMDRITPRPGSGGTRQWTAFALESERVVEAVSGQEITIDAPVLCAIEERWGGGEIYKITSRRIQQVGIENLRLESVYDPSVRQGNDFTDERHSGTAVSVDNAEHVWIRDCHALHFGYWGIYMRRGAKWVTAQDIKVTDPVSVVTGGRRYAFHIEGSHILFQRCFADNSRHAFVLGSRVSGPNVFHDSVAVNNRGSSEPHHRWSVGGLFDNVKASIAIQDRQWMGSGHGWAGANYVVWNSEGPIIAQKPPTAHTWVFGHIGARGRPVKVSHEQAHFESHGAMVQPESLYLQQLRERLGPEAVANIARGAGR